MLIVVSKGHGSRDGMRGSIDGLRAGAEVCWSSLKGKSATLRQPRVHTVQRRTRRAVGFLLLLTVWGNCGETILENGFC